MPLTEAESQMWSDFWERQFVASGGWQDDWKPPANNVPPGCGPDIIPRELRGKKIWTLDNPPPAPHGYSSCSSEERAMQLAIYKQKADEATPSPDSHQSKPSPSDELKPYHPNTTRKRKEAEQEKEVSEELGLEEKMMGAAGSLGQNSAMTDEEYSSAQEEEESSSIRKEDMTPREYSENGRRPLQPLVMSSNMIEEEYHSSVREADDESLDKQAAPPPQRIIKRVSRWVEEIYEPDQDTPGSFLSPSADESPCPTQGPRTLKRALGSPIRLTKKRKVDVEDSDDDLPSSQSLDTVGARIINGFPLLKPAVAVARDNGQRVRRGLNTTHGRKTKKTAIHEDGNSPSHENDEATLQGWWHPGRVSADDTSSAQNPVQLVRNTADDTAVMQDPTRLVQAPADFTTPGQSDKENITPAMMREEGIAENRRIHHVQATQEDNSGDFIHLPLMGHFEDQESPSHRVSRTRIDRRQNVVNGQRYEPYGQSARARRHARSDEELLEDMMAGSDYSDAPTAEISEPPSDPFDHPASPGAPHYSPITPNQEDPASAEAPKHSPLTPAEDVSAPLPPRRKAKGNNKKKAKKPLNLPSNPVSKKPSVRKAKAPLVPLLCKTRSKASSDTKFMALNEKCTPVHLKNPPRGCSWRRAQKILF